MAMTKICNINDVQKGKMKGFAAGGKKLLVSNIDGKFYCIDSTCNHRGGPLQDGDLEGNIVTCPWHGAQFDVCTGKAHGPPATGPVNVHKTEVKGSEVWADL
ncbi:MAG: non-heme iron oxygenase ferredoxin subunit [Candidatus Aenigmarchaeota archaeon]|nr:non-heme iron oxygenase ferredoxin subunit [Candidatus Aenigmarchaeota archaeon]